MSDAGAPVLTLADVRRLVADYKTAIIAAEDAVVEPIATKAEFEALQAAPAKVHAALDAALVAWDAERQRLADSGHDVSLKLASPPIGDVREAWLLAADVASCIRDEYEARGRDETLSQSQRDRANRDATVARQIKGQILAYAGIQEWPAPKPSDAERQRLADNPEADATERIVGTDGLKVGKSSGHLLDIARRALADAACAGRSTPEGA